MSYKKPCLVSNTSSIPEVVGNGAMLVDPYSIDKISSGINKIILDKNYKMDIAKKGELNLVRFSWDNCAEETLYNIKNM